MFTDSSIAKDGINLVYLGLKSLQILQAIVKPAAKMRRKLVVGIQLRATLLNVSQGYVQRAQGECGVMYGGWCVCDSLKETKYKLAGLGSKADHSDD